MSTVAVLQSDAKIASERLRILEGLQKERTLTPEEERQVRLNQNIITRWIAVSQRYLKALEGK